MAGTSTRCLVGSLLQVRQIPDYSRERPLVDAGKPDAHRLHGLALITTGVMSMSGTQHSRSLWAAALPAVMVVPGLYILWQSGELLAVRSNAWWYEHWHTLSHVFVIEFVSLLFISCVAALAIGLPLAFWFRAHGILTRARVYVGASVFGLLAGVGYACLTQLELAGVARFSVFMLVTWGLGGLVLGLASGLVFGFAAGVAPGFKCAADQPSRQA